MDVKAKIKEVMVQLLKVREDELKDNLKLCDGIGVDSTEMVELVIALEKTFNTQLSPKEVTKFLTIEEIEKIIQDKIKS